MVGITVVGSFHFSILYKIIIIMKNQDRKGGDLGGSFMMSAKTRSLPRGIRALSPLSRRVVPARGFFLKIFTSKDEEL